jgi:hypothetical protein
MHDTHRVSCQECTEGSFLGLAYSDRSLRDVLADAALGGQRTASHRMAGAASPDPAGAPLDIAGAARYEIEPTLSTDAAEPGP